jgi:hypothetical protein
MSHVYFPFFRSNSIGKLYESKIEIIYAYVEGLLINKSIWGVYIYSRPPMWSSGKSSWLQIERFRVRFPTLPDFLGSSGWVWNGTIQPRDNN